MRRNYSDAKWSTLLIANLLVIMLIAGPMACSYLVQQQGSLPRPAPTQAPTKVPVPTSNPNNPCAGLPAESQDDCYQDLRNDQAMDDYYEELYDGYAEDAREAQYEIPDEY